METVKRRYRENAHSTAISLFIGRIRSQTIRQTILLSREVALYRRQFHDTFAVLYQLVSKMLKPVNTRGYGSVDCRKRSAFSYPTRIDIC